MASTIRMKLTRETTNYYRYEGRLANGKIWYCYVPKPEIIGLVGYSFRMTPKAEADFFVGSFSVPAPDPQPHKSAKSRSQYNKSRSARAKRANKIKRVRAK